MDQDQLNRANRGLFLMTQLEILKSRPLREEVIRQYAAMGNDDLTLAAGSPAIDAGDPSISDPDGSRSDIGAFGGPFSMEGGW